MRLRLLALLAALALSLVLLAPTAALATDTETLHFTDSVSFTTENPCSGAVGTLTISFMGVFHITQLDNGTFHETSTLTGTATFVPDDPSQPTYSGKFTEWDGLNVNAKTFTATDTVNIVLRGTDGSMVKEHALFRMTVNANGTVTSVITTDEFTCR